MACEVMLANVPTRRTVVVRTGTTWTEFERCAVPRVGRHPGCRGWGCSRMGSSDDGPCRAVSAAGGKGTRWEIYGPHNDDPAQLQLSSTGSCGRDATAGEPLSVLKNPLLDIMCIISVTIIPVVQVLSASRSCFAT